MLKKPSIAFVPPFFSSQDEKIFLIVYAAKLVSTKTIDSLRQIWIVVKEANNEIFKTNQNSKITKLESSLVNQWFFKGTPIIVIITS
jgi:hypothetical protein